MVGLTGFEPVTSPLSGVRSNQLSYRPANRYYTNRNRGDGSGIGRFRVTFMQDRTSVNWGRSETVVMNRQSPGATAILRMRSDCVSE